MKRARALTAVGVYAAGTSVALHDGDIGLKTIGKPLTHLFPEVEQWTTKPLAGKQSIEIAVQIKGGIPFLPPAGGAEQMVQLYSHHMGHN